MYMNKYEIIGLGFKHLSSNIYIYELDTLKIYLSHFKEEEFTVSLSNKNSPQQVELKTTKDINWVNKLIKLCIIQQ